MTRLMAVPIVKERTPRLMSSMLRPLFDIRSAHIKGYDAGMSLDDKAHVPNGQALAAIKMAN
jgi:hypothetical protein